MRYLLVPDIGRLRERILAEILTSLIVSCLVAKLVQISWERHRLNMARMQAIAEMNHHIRNALTPSSLSLDATENQQLKSVIAEAVDGIDWALREILPRETPLEDDQRHELGYFQRRNRRRNERESSWRFASLRQPIRCHPDRMASDASSN